jgi:hypothetical protein
MGVNIEIFIRAPIKFKYIIKTNKIDSYLF